MEGGRRNFGRASVVLKESLLLTRFFSFSEIMSSDSSSSSATTSLSSDAKIPRIMQTGAEKMVVQGTIGLLIGFSAGIVLSRGGAGSGATRKVLAGLGGGAGLGSAWTRTSMQLEKLLAPVIEESSGGDGKN